MPFNLPRSVYYSLAHAVKIVENVNVIFFQPFERAPLVLGLFHIDV